jgi:hypothetical protein
MDDVRKAQAAFFEEAGRRLTECLKTRSPDDGTGEEEVQMTLVLDRTVADLVRWISGEIHVRYESLIELMFNYGVGAFLDEMREPDGWIYQRKNEHLRDPDMIAVVRAAVAKMRQAKENE